ncbi:iron chaperone [Krasilnikovia sp. MM14-A1004]|uniref:iron chaperone n=1 Tax=Krasilnikovia sp. MM14-A1004 TaxID=3373541 RepID=UPI00399CD9BE
MSAPVVKADAVSKPQTIDEYIEGFDGQRRELLDQLHALARQAVPDASEAIKWGHPAWVHPSGTILFVISGHAKHANFSFTPSTREAFDAELGDVETGKGTVKLPYGSAAPTDLLRRMIEYRVREFEDDGVLWK